MNAEHKHIPRAATAVLPEGNRDTSNADVLRFMCEATYFEATGVDALAITRTISVPGGSGQPTPLLKIFRMSIESKERSVDVGI